MQIKSIIFSQQAIQMFQSEIETFGAFETGGVMIGYLKDETVYVEKVSNGGPKAKHEYLYFRADNNYVEMFIDIEIANSNEKFRYLGEWHTHPEINPIPSEIDLNSLEEIANSSGDFCIGLILGSIDYSTPVFLERSICIIKHIEFSQFELLEININQ